MNNNQSGSARVFFKVSRASKGMSSYAQTLLLRDNSIKLSRASDINLAHFRSTLPETVLQSMLIKLEHLDNNKKQIALVFRRLAAFAHFG